MRNRDRLGLSLSPLLLRLLLAVIFVQAGLGKFLATVEVSPAEAALLSKMGVQIGAPATPPAPSVVTEPPAPQEPDEATPPSAAPGSGAPAALPDGPAQIRKLYTVALRIQRAAFPEPLEGGAKVRALWPPDLAAGGWPRHLAWAVAITEVLGGACLLLGILTRVWSLAIAGVMLGAIWLMQIGPAIQSGETVLGVLPAYKAWDTAAWQPLWLQFALLMSALALLFLGAGRLSLDGLLLGGGGDDAED